MKKIVLLLFVTGLIHSSFSQDILVGKKDSKGRYLFLPGNNKFDNVQQIDGFFTQDEITPGTKPEDVAKNIGGKIEKVKNLSIKFSNGTTVPLTEVVFWNELSAGSKPLTRMVILLPETDVIVSKEGVVSYIASCNRNVSGKWVNRPNRISPVQDVELLGEFLDTVYKKIPKKNTKQEKNEQVTDDFEASETTTSTNTKKGANNQTTETKSTSVDKEVDKIIGGAGLTVAELLTYDGVKKNMELGDLVHKNKVIRLESANDVAAAEGRAQVRALDQAGQNIVNASYAQQQSGPSQQEIYAMMLQQQEQAKIDKQRRIGNGIAIAGLVLGIGGTVFNAVQQNKFIRASYAQQVVYTQPQYPQQDWRGAGGYGGGYGRRQHRGWNNGGGGGHGTPRPATPVVTPGPTYSNNGNIIVTNSGNTTTTTTNNYPNNPNTPHYSNNGNGSKGWSVKDWLGSGTGGGSSWTDTWKTNRGTPLMQGGAEYDRRWQLGPMTADGQSTMWTPYDPRVLRLTDGTPIATSGPTEGSKTWNSASAYTQAGVNTANGTQPWYMADPKTNNVHIPPTANGGNYTPPPAIWGNTGGTIGVTNTNPTVPVVTTTNTGNYTTRTGGGSTGGW